MYLKHEQHVQTSYSKICLTCVNELPPFIEIDNYKICPLCEEDTPIKNHSTNHYADCFFINPTYIIFQKKL